MMQVTIYHNPRCSKSRDTLKLLTDRGIEPDVVLYLVTPPDSLTLSRLVEQLGIDDVRQMMRTKESLYRQLALGEPQLTQGEVIATLSQHPTLLERPIVIYQNRARLGRPPEQVLSLFTD